MDIIYTGIDLTWGSNSVGNLEPSVSRIGLSVKITTCTRYLYKVLISERQADTISPVITEECNVIFRFKSLCDLESEEK